MKSLFLSLIFLITLPVLSAENEWSKEPGYTKSSWAGFTMYQSKSTKIVVPNKIAAGKPWIWRARFWGHEPQFDIAMLKRGYHVVYCEVGNLFGSLTAVKRWDEFYAFLHKKHNFGKKAILEGMSRGGLIIYNWAAANPEKVDAIYGDAPVLDFKSWPGSKFKGSGSPGDWRTCLNAYGFTEKEALAYTKNPLDNLAPLANAGIPIFHVVGDKDQVVPVNENTSIAAKRYKKLGGTFKVIHKPNAGHNHGLKDPAPLVNFMIKHTSAEKVK